MCSDLHPAAGVQQQRRRPLRDRPQSGRRRSRTARDPVPWRTSSSHSARGLSVTDLPVKLSNSTESRSAAGPAKTCCSRRWARRPRSSRAYGCRKRTRNAPSRLRLQRERARTAVSCSTGAAAAARLRPRSRPAPDDDAVDLGQQPEVVASPLVQRPGGGEVERRSGPFRVRADLPARRPAPPLADQLGLPSPSRPGALVRPIRVRVAGASSTASITVAQDDLAELDGPVGARVHR